MELYYFIILVVHTFMRPTDGEICNIKHQDIKEVNNPKSLEILYVDRTAGTRILNTTTYAVGMYKNLINLYPNHGADDYILFPQYKNRETPLRVVNRQLYLISIIYINTNIKYQNIVSMNLDISL